jgi:hypothetical protein
MKLIPESMAIKTLAVPVFALFFSAYNLDAADKKVPAAMDPPDVKINAPPVTAPPESFFQMVENRVKNPYRGGGGRRRGGNTNEVSGTDGATNQAAANRQSSMTPEQVSTEMAIYHKFYKKYIDVKGMPVVAAGEVSDLALQRTYDIVTHLLAGRPDVLQSMVTSKTYLIIIGKNQVYTDMPEYRNHPDPAYQNERVRGTGGNPTSFGEENLLSLPIDRYDDESIGVHEFCHTIDSAMRSVDPTWTDRKNKVYRDALAKGLWKNTYAGSNPGEFWSEICQSYFDNNRVNNWNHGPIANRQQLKEYDPDSYELVKTAFNLSPEQDWHYTWLQKLPKVTAPPEKFNIDPYYTKFTWAREFTVIGRGASDEAMLKANDTIRKMFAYRHDILKAIIADGGKLVVLGRNEKITDLPEFKDSAKKISSSTRSFDYSPDKKLLVVPEENILGKDSKPATDPCEVIGEFSRALYLVTANRPVDPNWNSRGRSVQQYEMRVKRLDVQFDEKLKAIYEPAMKASLWKGTPATKDRVEYWAEGVMAYFDANGSGGQSGIPRTREDLQKYDPALYALVHETMAYQDHVDWRYTPYRP